MNLRYIFFAIMWLSGYGFHGKPVGWGQLNRQRLDETMLLPCHNLRDLEEQRGRGFLNLSCREKGKSHKQEELLWGAIKKLSK